MNTNYIRLFKVIKIIAISFLLLVLATIAPVKTYAETLNIHKDAGTTGAAFLKIQAGSRPASMGGAFVGLADDVNAVFYNPAGLTSIADRELTAMQNFWFADVNNESISYAQKIGNGAFGLSFLGAFAKIDQRSAPTEDPERTFTAGAFAAGLSYSYELTKFASVGGTVKVISQQFDVEDWTGVAGDAGLLIGMKRLRLGASIRNLGTLRAKINEKTETESLPTNIRVGGAAHLLVSEATVTPQTAPASESTTEKAGSQMAPEIYSEGDALPEPEPILTIAGDVNIPIQGGYPTVHLGGEYWLYGKLALRAGYSFSQANNASQGVTVGLGLRAWGTAPLENMNFQFDYAFAPNGDVGDTHRISFISRF